MTSPPRVSFLVPAHNEEALIGRCVCSITKAASELGLDHEIIVADDASTDHTADTAIEMGAIVVRVEHRQISRTRNSAARRARGEIFIFVDGDSAVSTGAVREAIRALERGCAGGGGTIHFDGTVPLYWRFLLPPLQAVLHSLRLCGGCFMFCTREAFERSGGFDETLFASEEVGFARAIRRHGPFVIVREPVITSGRKTRTLRPHDFLMFVVRSIASRGKHLRDRERLGIWYGERPIDPHTESLRSTRE